MSEPFIAEIRIFAGNFAPRGWAFCNGQLLPIAQNTAVFSLVGTTYGGDGRTTLGLPNLQGRAPMHAGNGPGLSSRRLGQSGGVESVALTEAQMPNHTHALQAGGIPADDDDPANQFLGTVLGGNIYHDATNQVNMAAEALPPAGSNPAQPHNNLQPFLTLNFIFALVGLFPSRS